MSSQKVEDRINLSSNKYESISQQHSISSIIKRYKNLPKLLRKQLSHLDPYLESETTFRKILNRRVHVNRTYSRALSELDWNASDLSDERNCKILIRMAWLELFSAGEIIDLIARCFSSKDLICYHPHQGWIRLFKTIKVGRHVRVISGYLHDQRPVVIKWYSSGKRDTTEEIKIYEKLKSVGCPLPKFWSSFEFWNNPILVLERLISLDETDDYRRIGRDILKQLYYIHQVCIHNDIKPDNIMKTTQRERSKYLLIDYGGVAQEKLGQGFRRRLWSPRWTCQPRGISNQVTTPWHDFYELGSTLRAIRGKDDVILRNYFRHLHRLDPLQIRPRDYTDLRTILKN